MNDFHGSTYEEEAFSSYCLSEQVHWPSGQVSRINTKWISVLWENLETETRTIIPIHKLVETLHHVCSSPRLLEMEGSVNCVLGVGYGRLAMEWLVQIRQMEGLPTCSVRQKPMVPACRRAVCELGTGAWPKQEAVLTFRWHIQGHTKNPTALNSHSSL